MLFLWWAWGCGFGENAWGSKISTCITGFSPVKVLSFPFFGAHLQEGEKRMEIHFLYTGTLLHENTFWKTVLSPIESSWHLVKSQLTVDVWLCLWTCSREPLTDMSVLRPVPQGLGYYRFIVSREIRSSPSIYFFIFRNVLLIPGSSCFQRNFRISL